MAANYQGQPSSFFMFCFGDSSKLIKLFFDIPKAFAKKHEVFLQQGWLQLKTSSILSWKERIMKSRSNDDVFQIKDGWPELPTITIFSRWISISRRSLSLANSALQLSKSRFFEEIPAWRSHLLHCHASPSPNIQSAKTWRLIKELKSYNISQRLEIPTPFVEGTGIATKPTVLLRNEEGEEWVVALTNRRMMKYSFTHGWSRFLNENGFRSGDILLFEFVGNNVIVVEVVEKEAGRDLIGRSKRGGFLNPYLVL